MCIHPELVRLTTGWYCPDCGETFEERPKPTKITFLNTEEAPVEETPKPKRTRKPKTDSKE
jgi:hypothetical protein